MNSTEKTSKFSGNRRAVYQRLYSAGNDCRPVCGIVDPSNMPPWQVLQLAAPVALPQGGSLEGNVELFSVMYAMTSGAVTASMVAYITAQYCDVQLFHFWKRVTKGKHLWIRNNLVRS